MRFCSQNLKADGDRGWHGRGWLYFEKVTLGLEWHLPTRMCHASMTFGGEEPPRDIMLTLAIPWVFAVYFSIMGLLPRDWLPERLVKSVLHPGEMFWMPVERESGVSIHDKGIWFSLWRNPAEGNADDPWWMHNVIFPLDILLGRETSRSEEYDEGSVSVNLPEGMYLAHFVLTQQIAKRPRWPWSRVYLRGEITPQIPIPGKGESAWDMDDDAISNFDCLAADAQELVEKLEASVLQTRARYGGWDWQDALTKRWLR